jgi:TolA-binding protein
MQAGEAETRVMGKREVEERDRLVDRAALEAQTAAAGKLRELLKRYRGSVQEPLLLGRLAESLQQEGAIRFRIAHGKAHRSGGAVDLTDFRKAMKTSIASLDELIAKFPHFENIQEAWFLRGRAYEEIENKVEARKNFLQLVTRWPDALQAPPAYMSLASFAIDENKHQEAIGYLEAVEKRPDDPQYPFALYKLAWSHYNLKRIPAALAYLERHIAFYDARAGETRDASDIAMRDNSLNETALFYVEGLESGLPDYTAAKAYGYFRGLEKGPALGKVMLRFARLLRAHNREEDLELWKKTALRDEMSRPESLEVVMTLFEDRVNKRRFEALPEVSRDLEEIVKANRKTLASWDSYPKAQELLVKTIEDLRTLVIRNKKATELGKLSATLAELSLSLVRILDAQDPRVPGVHYNLAETMFEIEDFERATVHYRWVLENWKDRKSFDVRNASLRALSSRYEVLRRARIVPKELAAKAFPPRDEPKVDARLEEWTGWIDAHAREFAAKAPKRDEADETFANLDFEANRALYAAGQPRRAVARMLSFSEAAPTSRFAVPSAALALDTYLLSGDWERTYALSKRLGGNADWKKSEFGTRLAKVEADAYYKLLEGKFDKKDTSEALAASRECLDKYKNSERFPDCLLMAARASVAEGDEEEGQKHLSRLVREKPETEAARHALYERARIQERNYRFADAFEDYRSYLARGGELREAQKRLLPLARLSGDTRVIASLLEKPETCSGDQAAVCDRVTASLLLEDASFQAAKPELRSGLAILSRLSKTPSENRALWALVGLGDAKIGFQDRLELLDALADGWDSLESGLQLQASRKLVPAVKTALESNRRILRSSFTLKPEKKSIARRLERVRDLEERTVKIVKMPWIRLRVEALNELASAYADLGEDLRAIPAPKELPEAERPEYEQTLQKLALPFDEKAVEMRGKAFELASTSEVDEETFAPLAEAFAKENPSQVKTLAARTPASARAASESEMLPRLAPTARWARYTKAAIRELNPSDDKERLIDWSWRRAFEEGQWPQIAFFLSEAQAFSDARVARQKKEGNLSSEERNARDRAAEAKLASFRYFTLLKAGARAEARQELAAARGKMDLDGQAAVNEILGKTEVARAK